MPSDRLRFNTQYTRTLSEKWKDCFVGIDAQYVFRQTHLPADFDSIDYPRPPKGYFLLDASAGACVYLSKQPFYLSLTVANLLNARYRDYLDAFRYFIDQPGTNMIVRVRVPLEWKAKSN
jgi:iron complex outermembrane receptor protein